MYLPIVMLLKFIKKKKCFFFPFFATKQAKYLMQKRSIKQNITSVEEKHQMTALLLLDENVILR